MVPKIHAKGKSFRGAAAYLLHDKDGAQTNDRVSWTETINLFTADPDIAWRVMAATAMKQSELKAASGVATRGRKSVDTVMHVTLAWHPDQTKEATRAEMMRAVRGALRAIQADNHQALVICHTDERQPHIHVLINRVNPETGRMLSSSQEKLRLSQWAESYEKETGGVLCEQRVLNNDARRRKNYTRGKKDKARHLYEELAQARPSEQAQKEQRDKDAALARDDRAARQEARRKWADLQAQYKDRVAAIKRETARDVTKAQQAVRETFRPEYHTLLQEHQARMARFIENEKTLIGRVYNALRAIDFRAIMRGDDLGPEGQTRRQAVGQAFNALSSAGVRKLALESRYKQEQQDLERRENREERASSKPIRTRGAEALKAARSAFDKDRAALITAQKREGLERNARWKARGEERSQAWQKAQAPSSGRGREGARDQDLADRLSLIEAVRRRLRTPAPDRDRDRD